MPVLSTDFSLGGSDFFSRIGKIGKVHAHWRIIMDNICLVLVDVILARKPNGHMFVVIFTHCCMISKWAFFRNLP